MPSSRADHRYDRQPVRDRYLHVVVDGKPIGDLGDAEALWHTDMSYNDVPPMGSALYALEVPPTGGETGSATCILPFEMLPVAMRKRVSALQCKHDSSRNSTGSCVSATATRRTRANARERYNPLVRTHPVTGRSALFLGRRRNASIVGLPLAESETLLDECGTRDQARVHVASGMACRRSRNVWTTAA
jgi:taurine dioxygenase